MRSLNVLNWAVHTAAAERITQDGLRQKQEADLNQLMGEIESAEAAAGYEYGRYLVPVALCSEEFIAAVKGSRGASGSVEVAFREEDRKQFRQQSGVGPAAFARWDSLVKKLRASYIVMFTKYDPSKSITQMPAYVQGFLRGLREKAAEIMQGNELANLKSFEISDPPENRRLVPYIFLRASFSLSAS